MSRLKVIRNPYRMAICSNCALWGSASRSCLAFARIPREIWGIDGEHSKVIPDQKGDFIFTLKENDYVPG